jgi:four helix bundle protein
VPEQRVRDYRDLLVWKEAMQVALDCEDVCDRLPRQQWRLASQIRGAANSVHANIAEGNGSFSTADYIKHLGYSSRSLRELESHLHFVRRRYPGIRATPGITDRCLPIAKMLAGLVKALRKRRERGIAE